MGGGDGGAEFDVPAHIAVDEDGDVFVLESFGFRVVKLDTDGNQLTTWGTFGNEPGQFSYPRGISVDDRGDVYVADTANNRIQKLDANGAFLAAWGAWSYSPGDFDRPVALAVDDAAGTIYVADQQNRRVQMLGLDGEYLGQWNAIGTLQGIAVYDLDRRLYISASADAAENNLQRYDIDGNFLVIRDGRSFGSGRYINPVGIAVTRDSN